jgi:hypothetical protein
MSDRLTIGLKIDWKMSVSIIRSSLGHVQAIDWQSFIIAKYCLALLMGTIRSDCLNFQNMSIKPWAFCPQNQNNGLNFGLSGGAGQGTVFWLFSGYFTLISSTLIKKTRCSSHLSTIAVRYALNFIIGGCQEVISPLSPL